MNAGMAKSLRGKIIEDRMAMGLRAPGRARRAFTRVELVVVIAVIGMLAAWLSPLVIPRHKRSGDGHATVQCISNLRQVALAFRIFAGDNDDVFPYGAAKSPALSNQTSAWLHFQAMSNELASTRILVCPFDATRRDNLAFDFSTSSTGFAHPSKQNGALSYFVNLSADETAPQTLLVGDRNLGASERALAYSSLSSGAMHIPTNSTWSRNASNRLHDKLGIIARSDGSVERAATEHLQAQLKKAVDKYGTNANWFLFPQ
ncbi:MAG: type II secretion system protein [Verrucomicrobiota bacterium]